MPPASRSTLSYQRFHSSWLAALVCCLAAERAHAELRVSALTQVDWVIHRQSSQDELDPATRVPLNEDRFVLRRGRVGVEGQKNAFGARLELDMNTLKGLTLRPFEALVFARYARATQASAEQVAKTPPDFTVLASAGLMRIPFGFDAVEPDTSRPLLERSDATRAFFGQARDLGVGAGVTFRFARLSVAMMNGEPLSDDRYAGLALTRSKDFIGRAGIDTPASRSLWVQAGASCLFGTGLHLGSPGTKDSLQWADGNENGQVESTELIPIAGAPASASQTFERSALGADLRVGFRLPVLGFLVVRAELTRALNLDRTVRPADPVASGRDLRELAAQVGLSQELTRYGEAAVRYDVYQPDADATRQRAASVVPRDTRFRTWSVSLAGKLAPARLLLQYDHRRNALGRALNGAPTTLKDDTVTLRAEVRL
jgi:hypothetical protein